ncbi:MAG: phosphoribosylformylglycinamidine synthase [Treponema sp.]|nr:phosphoribosylformylglycinamidine synthase [Treponema sp.]
MYRIFIEKKAGFDNEALRIKSELTDFLGISGITEVRYLNRYDIENITYTVADSATERVFSDFQTDYVYHREIKTKDNDTVIVWEYLPGQYDQRADNAEQNLTILQEVLNEDVKFGTEGPKVRCAKVVIISGDISLADVEQIQNYLVNPVDSRLITNTNIPKTLQIETQSPDDIPVQTGFINYNNEELKSYHDKMQLAMDMADTKFMQDYFKKINRDPTETEIKLLDTYWSDHCRHTTFNTVLENIEIEDGDFKELFEKSLSDYTQMRTDVYGEKDKPVSLMDIACIGAKYLKKHGKLDDIEISKEVNACSIYIDVHTKDTSNKNAEKTERWLLMFKNETHNHPTEIEPFGGAATCVGGAIRDPLSGRSWVYQSMRVTGASDPTVQFSATLESKLPQRKLTQEAAQGYSSYGNQIGLTAGQVTEIYHSGFEAKRMELGAVIAAAPADIVIREEPEAGDCIVLVGGATGRDGIGGATGSSKVHTAESFTAAAAEVQKGNAVEERKIQRLFRNPEVSRIIRRCNDFGAGGVSVAVGELADGLEINLDAVPTKYEGLNGTELALSESQERMALVVREKDVDFLIKAAAEENLNATVIATVTNKNRLVMKWRGKTIVDIDREFLDTAGAGRSTRAKITNPVRMSSPLCQPLPSVKKVLATEPAEMAGKTKGIQPQTLKKAFLENLSDLACSSQRGLTERFDSSIGAATILFPMGGKYQSTPEAGMVAKIPVLPPFETSTTSLMSFGYDPRIAQWSPWHGAQIAVLHSLAKITAMGGDAEKARLSFQEYFEKMINDESWGKPSAALLGALSAQKAMGTPSIGGKDSMSGTFKDLCVPPTLVSFAVATENVANITSGAFKNTESHIYVAIQSYSEVLAPEFETFKENARRIYEMNKTGKIRAMYPVGAGGIAEAVSKMAFGNKIGCYLNSSIQELLFVPLYGSIVIETEGEIKYNDLQWLEIGRTQEKKEISILMTNNDIVRISLDEAINVWEKPLSEIFPQVSNNNSIKSTILNGKKKMPNFAKKLHKSVKKSRKEVEKKPRNFYVVGADKPKVLIPVFPGTNIEYDLDRAFTLAGAETKTLVFRNNTKEELKESLEILQKEIDTAQILALSGGFSAGDSPDSSGKFIANILRINNISDAVMSLIKDRDSLVLGIGSGFQALLKVGLLPFGEIYLQSEEDMPTLTFNTVGRHVSRIVRTRVTSCKTAWANDLSLIIPDYHLMPISHREGRLIINEKTAKELFKKGQVFSQYIDENGKPAITEPDNPTGSNYAIEGLVSPDGNVLGKIGHSERAIEPGHYHLNRGNINNVVSTDLLKNIPGNMYQNIFEAGVRFFV